MSEASGVEAHLARMAGEYQRELAEAKARIAALEGENERLHAELSDLPACFERGHHVRHDHQYSGVYVRDWLKDYVREGR